LRDLNSGRARPRARQGRLHRLPPPPPFDPPRSRHGRRFLRPLVSQ
jgi:hypothetical protein